MGELTRYRRKAEEVAAVQFNINDKPWPFDIHRDEKTGWYYADIGSPMRYRVHPGDWLVTSGDKHPVTHRVAADLFPKMYEPLKGD